LRTEIKSNYVYVYERFQNSYVFRKD